MSNFTDLAMKPKGEIPENIDEQIAGCKAEIAELEGNGTIVSAVINFVKEGDKAIFSSASSSDNGKKDPENKDPENKDKKLLELKAKLANLSEKKRPQGQSGKSSDSSDELSKDELNGDLADYVNRLNEAQTPYEVVRGKGGMIGIKTTAQGDDSKSMSNMIENFMKKVGGKMSDNADNKVENSSNVENSGFDAATNSQLSKVLNDLNKAGVIEPDDKDTKKSVQNPEDKSQEQDGDKKEKGQNLSPPETPKVESQKGKGSVR